MKNMTKKEITELGKDLKMAKIFVLHEHGFSNEEISALTETPESVVRRFVNRYEENDE
jgi:hypothetical protein